MSLGSPRALPSAYAQKIMLEEQDNRCFWCDRRFGSTAFVRNRKRIIKLHWDHIVPYSFGADNTPRNFVAACSVCNSWKSSMMFNTIEEVRIYLYGKWKEAETQDGTAVFGLLEAFPDS